MMIEKYNCTFLQEKLSQGGQLIDVRSAVDQFLKDNIDQTKPVLLYCRTGARSGMAKRYLEQLGFEQVHNIGGVQQFISC